METYVVWTCSSGGSSSAVAFSQTTSYPTCPNGNGSYQTITLNDVNSTPDVQAQLELIGITAQSVSAAFFFGFGSYCVFWALGYVAKMAQDAIKSA